MKAKKLLTLSTVGLMAACALSAGVLTSCGSSYEIALVTDVGQLNDGGFNQGTWNGVVEFAKANNKTYKYYQPANGADATDADRKQAFDQAAEGGAKVIVAPGYLQETAITYASQKYTDIKFVFIDGWNIGQNNLTATSYKEEQSGYLAGYAAVMDGYTKLGGTFGGGGTGTACQRFAYGYVQGAQQAAAEKELADGAIEMRISYQYGSTYSASNELKAQIEGWYTSGTQVVFSCGGSMLQSVKAASASDMTNRKIIGVDVDQASEANNVITSAVKGLQPSVVNILNKWKEGKWDTDLANKTSRLGAAENATGLPTTTASWRFTTFTQTQYTTVFDKIAAGTLVVDSNVPTTSADKAYWETTVQANAQKLTIRYE